jgi:hypothetical protein
MKMFDHSEPHVSPVIWTDRFYLQPTDQAFLMELMTATRDSQIWIFQPTNRTFISGLPMRNREILDQEIYLGFSYSQTPEFRIKKVFVICNREFWVVDLSNVFHKLLTGFAHLLVFFVDGSVFSFP